MSIIKAKNLACPLDGKNLYSVDNHLRCDAGHTYDIARQGYVHLLPVQDKRSRNPGDSKAMVIARTEFLNSGVYEPIARHLTATISTLIDHSEGMCLLDAGCGEGYYLDYIAHALEDVTDEGRFSFIGLDISKDAIISASKRNRQISWIVGTNRQPPIEDNSVDIIICVFGFQSIEGFSRILKSDGMIILVEPGSGHLSELKEIIYADVKKAKANSSEYKNFSLIDRKELRFKTGALNNKQINNLLLMTPHLFRATKEGKESASLLDELDVSVDIVFRLLQKKFSEKC